LRVLRVGLAQIDCTVGAVTENAKKITDYIGRAAAQRVDFLAFPELAICGYPPEDLLFKPQFIADTKEALHQLAKSSCDYPEVTLLVGCLDSEGGRLYNSAAVIKNGAVLDVYHKHHLPNYGVFDEKRYFTSGRDYLVLEVAGVAVGVSICEDIWHKSGPPGTEVEEGGAELVVNINASPYHIGKPGIREDLLSEWSRDHMAALVYINMVGGQDELVFDGQSLVFDSNGELLAVAAQFVEELLIVDIDADKISDLRRGAPQTGVSAVAARHRIEKLAISATGANETPASAAPLHSPLSRLDEILEALCLGLVDYTAKNGFSHVVLGLSGGVDSALTASIAAEALGRDKVTSVFLPSRYTSTASLEDAAALSENLGTEMLTIPIEPVFRTYMRSLGEVFGDYPPDVTEENLQARIRGNILMALSNKFGWLLLSTGHKSEMSVGYTTLYGDMTGGFSLLKDVFKTLVYELARHLNIRKGHELIPERILTKPPSAELRPDQKDSDSLPDYSLLDPILRLYIEEEKGVAEIAAMGFPRDLVEQITDMVDGSEYKRRQGPPGVKITPRAFGKDWRVPITNRLRLRK
jgi:NAD+ synthase (glutamine-hydrolysing)